MAEEREGGRGYEQFEPPQAPPGMYLDAASGLLLPQGTRLASRAEVARAWFLGLALFIGTLGIGYIIWSVFEWADGRSPAQRMLGLRVWWPDGRQVAGRGQTAERQVIGFGMNGQALSGVFIWLFSARLRSVGDLFAGTVMLSDPARVLPLSRLAGGDTCARISYLSAACWWRSPGWHWWCSDLAGPTKRASRRAGYGCCCASLAPSAPSSTSPPAGPGGGARPVAGRADVSGCRRASEAVGRRGGARTRSG
jgi:uncharacterized RDD family membrane protein YckC